MAQSLVQRLQEVMDRFPVSTSQDIDDFSVLVEVRNTLSKDADDLQFFAALQACGVDNWDGYEFAQDMVREWNGEEE